MKFSSLQRECNARMRVADSAAEEVSGRITSALPAAAAKKKNVRLEYDTGACVIRPPPGKRDQWSLSLIGHRPRVGSMSHRLVDHVRAVNLGFRVRPWAAGALSRFPDNRLNVLPTLSKLMGNDLWLVKDGIRNNFLTFLLHARGASGTL